MPDFFTGLVEGFQGRREAEYTRNAATEAQNRQLADRVFTYLLNSRDPKMQELALSGLMAPSGARKKGLAGFLGGVESSSDPRTAQILARMNEMVEVPMPPAAPAAPAPSVGSGSAGMSTNVPTAGGSAPMLPPGPPEPPDWSQPGGEAGEGFESAPDLQGSMAESAGAAPLPPPPPPESKWKRRGTGIPTAEEIDEARAQAQMNGRIAAAVKALQAQGAPPEMIQRAIMGMLGAPQSPNTFDAQTFGVELTPGGNVVPVSFNEATGQYFLSDGKTPVDSTKMKMVRMTGAAGNGRPLRNVIENADGSRTAVYRDPVTYEHLYSEPDIAFTPPPAYSGTAIRGDAAGNPEIVGIPREGVPGGVLGNAPNPSANPAQVSAKALLTDVQRRIQAAEAPRTPGLPVRRLLPAQVDAIVQAAAREVGLPYRTLFDLQKATQEGPARDPAPAPDGGAGATGDATGASMAQRVLEEARRNRLARETAAAPTPPPPPPQPAPIPGRAVGAGPRGTGARGAGPGGP